MRVVGLAAATLLVCMGLAACATSPPSTPAPPIDLAAERAQLLQLHEQVMAAHRSSDVDLLFRAEAPDYLLANRGEVSNPGWQARRDRFAAYFASTRFAEYLDTVPPVAQVAADGSLGWVVAQVRGRGERGTGSDAREPVAFESAWIELYEKRQGSWWRVGNVSNFRPPPVGAGAAAGLASQAGAPASALAVVAAAQAAMGDVAALARIHGISTIADCTSPSGGAYQTELRSERRAGSWFMFRQTGAQRAPFTAFINGARAWSRDEGSGRATALDAASAAAIRGHDFQMIALEPLRHATKSELLPQPQAFAGAPHWVLRATDDKGAASEMYFDPTTHLLAGLRMPNPAGAAGDTVTIRFQQWQRFDGVLLPVQVTATDAKGDWVFRFRDLRLNQVEASLFAVPDSLR